MIPNWATSQNVTYEYKTTDLAVELPRSALALREGGAIKVVYHS
jgi:hypothetical protein